MLPGFFVLAAWVVVPLILFYTMPPHRAALLTFLSATMFLPVAVGFDLPVLPTIAKEELASLMAFGCLLGFARMQVMRAGPLRGAEVLMLVLAVGTIASVFGNQDSFRSGPVVVPGVDPTGFFSDILQDLLHWGFPFFIGRALFYRSRHLRDLLLIFVLAGLVYSLLILFEIRMSPQLHRWTYGYHQHSFAQTIRGDGVYRPMVYMRHGLHVALFAFLCMTAAIALMRARFKMPLFPFIPMSAISTYLAAIVLLCRSIGVYFYGLATGGVMLFTSSRLQVLAAVVIASIALSYPVIRVAEVLPLESFITFAEENFGKERARSFAGRMRTESQMMSKIQERPVFGWASSGRPMIRTASGRNATTYDGVWVIALVKGGAVRFFCIFVLLLWPVFTTFGRFAAIRSPQDRAMVAGLALMVSFNVFDLLPNSTTEGYLTLMSGALAGVVPGILQEQEAKRRAALRRKSAAPGPDESLGGALGRSDSALPTDPPKSVPGVPRGGDAGLGRGLIGRPENDRDRGRD